MHLNFVHRFISTVHPHLEGTARPQLAVMELMEDKEDMALLRGMADMAHPLLEEVMEAHLEADMVHQAEATEAHPLRVEEDTVLPLEADMVVGTVLPTVALRVLGDSLVALPLHPLRAQTLSKYTSPVILKMCAERLSDSGPGSPPWMPTDQGTSLQQNFVSSFISAPVSL